jgi:peptidoglycan/LPS O-acetylase OafA/YrhL
MVGSLVAIYNNKLELPWARLPVFKKNVSIFFCLLAVYKLHLGFYTIPLGGSTGLISNIAISYLMFASIHTTNKFSISLFSNRFVCYIGKISYSIYIWQQIFFSKKISNSFPSLILLFFILIIANLSYWFIEKPILIWRDKRVA